MGKIKIATWNVNSIRARVPNFLEWVEQDNPDVILLQELKCDSHEFPHLELEVLNYNISVHGEKGRNGVAILSKFPLYDVVRELPTYGKVDEDSEARYIEARFDAEGKSFKVASIYVPNGGPSVVDVRNGLKDVTATDNFKRKLKFCERLEEKFSEAVLDGEMALFGGDYNVCPNLYMDVYSPKKDGAITCTEAERQAFQALLNRGVGDIWRDLNPDLQDYTWWGYRPYTMWEKNQGYRLDAIMTTPEAGRLVKNCSIRREVRAQAKASDHVPLVCEISV